MWDDCSHFSFWHLMKKPKRLDIYIDESGDFSSYSQENAFYSIAFVFVDNRSDNTIALFKYKNYLENLYKGEHFVHVGNLVRGEKPYSNMLREERFKLFYSLFLLAYHSKHTYALASLIKPTKIKEIKVRILKEIIFLIDALNHFFANYDELVLHYDFGQEELKECIVAAFLEKQLNFKLIKTMQIESCFMQVADLYAYFELLKYKISKGYLSKSENAFFGGIREVKRKYIECLEDKNLLKDKKINYK